jgi:hypothetical protein
LKKEIEKKVIPARIKFIKGPAIATEKSPKRLFLKFLLFIITGFAYPMIKGLEIKIRKNGIMKVPYISI